MERYFEWDEEKSIRNFYKHGIRFEEAALVFEDPLAVSMQDRIVDNEERWQSIGMSAGSILLVVAHTFYDDNNMEIVRIISARRAEPKERRRYGHGQI